MKIFILDFSSNNSLAGNFPKRHEIIEENFDGAQAYKIIGEQMPDKIFINYADKPSHGRQTALSIKKRKKTANIPIYFVDGKEIENEKVSHIGKCIKTNEVSKVFKH